MKTIDDFNFSGTRVIVRVDFNVPLDKDFNVTDDTRIVATIPTIQKILKDGGAAILMSHLGRPKKGPAPEFSLKHTIPAIEKHLGQPVLFADDCIGNEAYELSKNLKPGQVLLLENLRFYPEEEAGDERFAEKLARHADFYVNDAFGTAHRAHASTAVIAKFFPSKKAFGYVMANEIKNVSRVLESTEKPVTAIIGGAKVSSKLGIISNLLKRVDNIIIGGGMAYTFVKAQGGNVGKSLVENDLLNTANDILRQAEKAGVKVYLPVDSVNSTEFSENGTTSLTAVDAIPEDMMGLDVGPKSLEIFRQVLLSSKVILWNGPVGVFEMKTFENGTVELGNMVAEATAKGAFSLVGGGDSVAAVKKYGLEDKVSYVSTGGGAMLEYLEGMVLPGIAAVLE
ncbi:phosphoglycerate kinase [Thermaurantimonas aggregans]|uniref:Phosphoglycerate kinase n=1 Tax=Thermaurantimonas aggregans TaxID=2173829 RepID=A0A401XMR4_9FLAO|nr:phosphoglycerate kinase [Thermaurantimonas aggregans]MCX8149412.1 phosphoglycerate kinase [Thermaurantimonas aggregans]GCD78292.1 phosphoglycerate kinase [Thermaurantimonas aggregans]